MSNKKEIYIVYFDFENKKIEKNFSLFKYSYEIANSLNLNINALIIGENNENLKKDLSSFKNLNKIYSIETKYSNLEIISDILLDFIKDKEIYSIIFSSNEITKSISARLAASLNYGLISDACKLKIKDNELFALKPAFDDQLLCQIYSKSQIKLITLNLNETYPLELEEEKKEKIINLKKEINFDKILFLEKNKKNNEKENLENSKIIIGLGRGVKEKDLPMIKDLAKILNANIGYTRPLIQEGFANEEFQIGITGKAINPEIYIAIGISGKKHHVNSIKAKTFISINTDNNASIKEISNYFINSDYSVFLPKLIEELKKQG